MQKALFTKTELFLINHNRRFVIDSAYHDSKGKLFKKTEDEIYPKFLGHYYDSLLRDCNIDQYGYSSGQLSFNSSRYDSKTSTVIPFDKSLVKPLKLKRQRTKLSRNAQQVSQTTDHR